jgi:hypothetical protein
MAKRVFIEVAYYLVLISKEKTFDTVYNIVQTISFIEISIEAGILLGGKLEACFVLGVTGIEPIPS